MFGFTDLSFDFLTDQPFLTALVFILFLIYSLYIYRRTNPPLSMLSRTILSGLRIIALLALFLALFEPVVSYRREFSRLPKMTVMVDKSRSMDIEENGRTRAGRIESFLSSDKFRDLASHFELTRQEFAGNIIDENESQLDVDKHELICRLITFHGLVNGHTSRSPSRSNRYRQKGILKGSPVNE